MSRFERRLPVEVEAVRLIRPVYDSEGNRIADTGEWILVDGREQYYMKDEDFNREFVRKGPEVVIEKEIQIQTHSYPIYIEKPVPYPCPQPWIKPWWDRGIVWCDNSGYTKSHSDTISRT